MRFRQLIHAEKKEIQSTRMHLYILKYRNSLSLLFMLSGYLAYHEQIQHITQHIKKS